ncbi:MAG: hypothetical protein ACP5N1_05545 [Candidatus Woesearchaeota archaeon]
MMLILGVLGIAFSLMFFFQKFNMMSTSFEVSDTIYLYLFAGFTLIAAVILLFRAIGLASMHYT